MRKLVIVFGFLMTTLFIGGNVWAHCEVPCGIYNDEARINEIHEHVDTIEKAVKQVRELSAAGELNHNQIARWVTTKEDHAKKIQEIIYQYFMTQRIKPVQAATDDPAYEKYVHELTLLHSILVSAMKTKQTLDASHTKAIRDYLEEFDHSYFGNEEQ